MRLYAIDMSDQTVRGTTSNACEEAQEPTEGYQSEMVAKDPKRRKAEELHSFLSSKNDMLHQSVSTDVCTRLKREIAVFHDTGERLN